MAAFPMATENEQPEYEINLLLDTGAQLKMVLFSDTEHRWIFKHRGVYPEAQERSAQPLLVNDTTLVVDYDGGVAQDCRLTMDIIRPDRRGKTYFLGVDISEGSRLFAEFQYEKQGDVYRMKTIDLGSHGRVELDALGEGLVKPVEVPFPLKDRVENEFGKYRIPFLKSDGEQAFFQFPRNYRRQF